MLVNCITPRLLLSEGVSAMLMLAIEEDQMGLLRALGLIIVVALLALVGFYAYLGGFSTVAVERAAYGPVEIMYATHRGPYQNLGQSWAGFQTEWEEAGLSACDSLAIYLDAPDTPPEELRSIIACRIDSLPEEEQAAMRKAFSTFTLPMSDALRSKFPYKNFLSYMLGPMKVYPEMQKILEAEGLEPAVGVETYGVMDASDSIGFVVAVGIDPAAYQPLFDAFDER